MAKRSHPPVKKIVVDFDDVSGIYYKASSFTDASKKLSSKYGLTDRAWRYRLKKFELQKNLTRSLILKKPKKKRLVAKPIREVMLTVHYKIKYEKIGKRGFHPIYLEGFYAKRLPANWTMEDVYGMMDIVRQRLEEYGDPLLDLLAIDDSAFENGIEVESIEQTSKTDGDYNYTVRRASMIR